ncbi:acyl-CoA reductase [Parapedobacter tibetensis]|uniref:acyl-CoA reductase n=1 Tax=Parapedobacter tibetensis TaxID=2972951 RepID=UPI00214D31E3|nr:acyl-CoA reductase [Parapedobacter tibetensis]
MTKKQRIETFCSLGEYLFSGSLHLQQIIESAAYYNSWFTQPNIRKALEAAAQNLTTEKLENWLGPYPFDEETDKTVGLIMAGNIPLVGFHDILCVLGAGFNVLVKPSSDDLKLTTHLLDKLQEIAPSFSHKITIAERLSDFDLVIATGNDNSARYFSYYFGNKPHIIRKNRNSAAVLTGKESKDELQQLGNDIFDYFGLGCRNVSKLFLPEGYDISTFFEGIAHFSDVFNHHKYANNYDYNKSIYLINGDRHYDNGFLLVKHDERIASPLAVLYHETYSSIGALTEQLTTLAPQLQCVVSHEKLIIPTPVVDFGQSQQPALDDYADGVNTLDFLASNME